MTTEQKARWVKWFLVGVALWPFAHFALTSRFGIDPWRLGGWAMYATSPVRVELNLARPTPEGEQPVERMSPAMMEWGGWYGNNGARLGTLYPPDGGAEIVFAANPDLDRIAIYVSHGKLSWDGEWGYSTVRYEYLRPGTRVATTPMERTVVVAPPGPPR